MTLTTKKILKILRRECFPAKLWYTATEVTSQIGDRRADILAFHRFEPGVIAGVEVKASRPDWLNELRDPAKAGAFRAEVSQWWVAAPAGVVKRDELPDGWGLLEVAEDGEVSRVAGRKRHGRPSDEVVWAFLRRFAAEVEPWAFEEGREIGKREGERKADDAVFRKIAAEKSNAFKRGESAERRRWQERARREGWS